ncbi:MAG: Spy0128 family protein [Lachnospiraceae bacterium]
MKDKVTGRIRLKQMRRYLAWLLSIIMVWGTVTPGLTATASTDRNWDVEYAFGTDEGIPLTSDDGGMRIHAKAGETITFYMTLLERSTRGRSRFQKEFHMYLPDELYESMTEKGDVFEDGWLESDLTECGYLMEADLDTATTSNATANNSTVRNATGSNALADNENKIIFYFTEELKKSKNPASIEIEEAVGTVDFCLEKDMILVLTQDGNDCRITIEEPVLRTFNQMSAQEMMVYLEIKESGGSFTDVVYWKPDYYKDEQVITLRVNYTFDKIAKSYAPGELKIEIESLSGYLSEATRESDRYTVAANQPGCFIDCDGWEHDYTSGQKGVITFTNEDTVDAGIDGYFEIQWTIKGTMIPDDHTFQAVVRDDEEEWKSNECTLIYEKDKKSELSLNKRAVTADKDELKRSIVNLPDNYKNYYWVKYYLNAGASEAAVLFAEYRLEDQFAADCIVLDETFKKVTNDFEKDGTIRTKTYSQTEWSGKKGQVLYVGYPKSQYQNGELIENTAYLHGRYEDMDAEDTDAWVTKTASCQLQLADFNFTSTDDLYAVTKRGQAGSIRLYEAQQRVNEAVGINHDGDGYNYYVGANAAYTGRPMDLVIGDDLLYISRTDRTTTKLKDGEYRFTHISIPPFTSDTGSNLVGYRFLLEVRLAGNDFYETYDLGFDTIPNGNPFHFFYRSIDIVAWRLTVYDVDKTIRSGTINTGVDVFTEDVARGYLHNFDYLQVYIDDELQNAANINNYSSYISRKEIASFDIDTYGNYLQRATYKREIIADDMPSYSVSKSGSVTSDRANSKSAIKWTLYDTMTVATGTPEDNYLEQVILYDLLPAGVTLREQDAIEVSYYTPSSSVGKGRVRNVKLKSGRFLLEGTELKNYFEERTVIDVVHDYKGSGRTKVTVMLDLADDPIDLHWLFQELWSVTNKKSISWFKVILYTEITDEDVLVYGNVINNYVYGEAKTGLEAGISYSNRKEDNGSHDVWETDINENNDVAEFLAYDKNSVKVENPGSGSSIQSLKKLVRTSQTNNQFVSPYGKSGLGEDYTYRLRIKTGNHPLGNIILYDTIERIVEGGVDITDGWYGYLQEFDITYAESLGFAPVIYYSDDVVPNPLSTHPGDWSQYDADTISDTDKATIKTIAFDLRYNNADEPVNLGANKVLYVDIHMKAPADLENDYAQNRFYTEWTKHNPDSSPLEEKSGLTSNIVKVDLADLMPPEVKIDLAKVDEHGDAIKHDTASFGIFYDAAAISDPVKDEHGDDVELTTDLTDGKAAASFALDESKSRFDGSDTYYMLYLRETEKPAGYYGLGGTKEYPTNQYIIKIKLVVEDDGSYSIQAVGQNQEYSVLTIADDTVEITVTDYREPVKFDLEAVKLYYDQNGTPQTITTKFDFKLTLTDGNEDEVAIPYDVVQNSINDVQAPILFEDIAITAAGQYKFQIEEVAGDNAEIKYDAIVIEAIVNVKADVSGQLVLDGEIVYSTMPEFKNYRLPEVLETLRVYKTLKGRPLEADEFIFEAEFTNGAPIKVKNKSLVVGDILPTVKNTDYGLVSFPEITFFQDDEYVFKITEKGDSSGGFIEFDENVYYAYIKIKTDDETNMLMIEDFEYYEGAAMDLTLYTPKPDATPMKNYPEFVNTSTAKVELEFELEKQLLSLDGTELISTIPEYQFAIALNKTETVRNLHEYVTIAAGKNTAVNQTSGNRKVILFDGITITAVGEYIFDVTEDNSGLYPGTLLDEAVIRITVKVMDLFGNSELSHSISYKKLDADGIEISGEIGDEKIFVNKLKSVSEALKVRKDLSGRPIKDGEFIFEASLVYPATGVAAENLTFALADGTVLSLTDEKMSALNQSGDVVFPVLTWKQAGIYIIEISEVDGGQDGIYYDDNRYYARVEVEKDTDTQELGISQVKYFRTHDGGGAVSDPCEGSAPVFKNHYFVTVDLSLMKRLLSAEAETDVELPLSETYAFNIRLKEGDDKAVVIPDSYQQGASNDSTGVILFEKIEINAEGIYQFEITEQIPDPIHPDHTADRYDPGKIIATVLVSNEGGVLKAGTVSYKKVLETGKEHHYASVDTEKNTTFINFFKSQAKTLSDSVILKAGKSLTGRLLGEGEFSFRAELIYASNGTSIATRTVTNDVAGNVVFPAYQFTEAGTYIFKIAEIKGSDSSVTYDTSVYYAQVTVTRSRNGEFDASCYYGTRYDETAKRVEGELASGAVPVYENFTNSSLTIEKISKSSGEPLTGAQFVLSYRQAGSEGNWTQHGDLYGSTGEQGLISLALPENYWQYEYCLEEVKAPSGYSKSNVGTILFRLNQDGTIAGWSNSGESGYVEISEDGTAFIVKNHTTGDGTGSPDRISPTSPTDPTDPTIPEPPTLSVGTDPERPGIVVPPGIVVIKDLDGNIIWEGNTTDGYIDIELPPEQYIIEVIDDQGESLSYLMDVSGSKSGLASTGDTAWPAMLLVTVMVVATAGFAAVLLVRRRKDQEL